MLRLFCLLAGLSATVTGACEAPFKVVGEGCYYFSVEDGIKDFTWTEARQHCLSMGSEVDLAMLDSVCDDFRNLGIYYRLQATVFGYSYAWIGATGVDDDYYWLDGRSFSKDSPYWLPEHPTLRNACVALIVYSTAAHLRTYLKDLNGTGYLNPFVCQDFSAALQK